jgi:hypothetical protein
MTFWQLLPLAGPFDSGMLFLVGYAYALRNHLVNGMIISAVCFSISTAWFLWNLSGLI